MEGQVELSKSLKYEREGGFGVKKQASVETQRTLRVLSDVNSSDGIESMKKLGNKVRNVRLSGSWRATPHLLLWQ